MRLNLICFAFQIGSGGLQQGSSPLFDPGALSLALTNVVDKLHRKNKQVCGFGGTCVFALSGMSLSRVLSCFHLRRVCLELEMVFGFDAVFTCSLPFSRSFKTI